MLAAEKGVMLKVRAEGAQATEAVDAVVELFKRGFDE